LKTICPDLLVVEHEPIKYAYSPKIHLRSPAAVADLRLSRLSGNISTVSIRQKSYVEVGFPAFAAAPLLVAEFGAHLRLVQFAQHPVRVAASVVAQKWFDPGKRNDIQADVAPAPTDLESVLAALWRAMGYHDAFRKVAVLWAEVHIYGLEARRVSSGPFPLAYS
jgi:hypothetical protein